LFSRRTFLKATGGLVVAITLSGGLRPRLVRAAGPASVPADQIDSWLAVGPDGTVTVFTGKVELGTGLATATRQIAAEELDLAVDRIKLVEGDTWTTPDQGYTAGSQSIKSQWTNGLRQAAATARQKLVQLAAAKLGTAPDQLTVAGGLITVRSDPNKKVAYSDLLGGKKFGAAVSQAARPKTPDQYSVIGKSVPREDIPAKVTGEFNFIQDVRVPGMVHARVVRPLKPAPSSTGALAALPTGTLHNATLDHVEEKSVSGIAGLLKVVVKKDFVGVVTEREEQAILAAKTLKVSWKDPGNLPDQKQLYKSILESKTDVIRVIANDGDVAASFAGSPKTFEATYQHPYQMHASIGPSCAVADVGPAEATVWSATQGVYQLRGAVATALGMQPQNVHVVYVEGSGCYGINGSDNAALDAALLSQAVGKPVRVQYMRHDEHGWENFGTPLVMRLRAAVGPDGRIYGWDHEDWTANRGGRPGPPGNIPTGRLAGFPEPAPPKSPPPDPPVGDDTLQSIPSYIFPNLRVRSYGVYQPWLFTGPLRSPARLQNTFANESFMDEIAAAMKVDPVEIRVRHAKNSRLSDVIKTVAKLAAWDARPSPKPAGGSGPATGRGIASVHYEGRDAYVAVVAEVEVDRATGNVKVRRVSVAHDAGIIINPDGIKNQVEGGVIQSISRALKEEVRFDRSGVTSLDWTGYPILRFNELPDEIRIELINRPDQPAVGAGEPTPTAVAGAIGNAIFDATGARLRELPFTPERVKAALP
jgi:CO/xanthine dehydrogenase Mo-binding subunit